MIDMHCVAFEAVDLDRLYVVIDHALQSPMELQDYTELLKLKSLVMRADRIEPTGAEDA